MPTTVGSVESGYPSEDGSYPCAAHTTIELTSFNRLSASHLWVRRTLSKVVMHSDEEWKVELGL